MITAPATKRAALDIWSRSLADFRYRYAGSMAGVFWHLAWPLAQIMVYSLVASFAPGSTFAEKALRTCGGLLPWFCFTEAMLLGTDAIGVGAATARFIAQSIPGLVAERVLVAGFGLGVSTTLFAILLTLLGHHPSPASLIVMVPSALLLLVFAFGLALGLSGLRILFPDVLEALRSLLALGVWTMPLVFPSGSPSALARLSEFNPPYAFIAAYRDALLHNEFPPLTSWLWMLGVAAVSVTGGFWVLRRIESDVRDEL